MKKCVLLSIMAAGVVGLAASLAMAADGAGAGAGVNRQGLRHRGGRLAAALELTADQKTQIKTIIQAAHKDAQNAAGQLDKLKIWKDAFQKITTTVLTADQEKKLVELLGKFKGQGAGGFRGRLGAHAQQGAAQGA
jgi:nitrate/nitrite-specific signal transduction histidine kinase